MNWKERRKQIRRGIKYPILVFFIKLFIFIIRFIPRKQILNTTAFLSKIAFKLVKSERLRTIENLNYIYSNSKSPQEIYNMARNVFINQGLNFADYAQTLHYTTRKQFLKLVDIEGEEHLKNAYEKGNGVLCLMMHVGSWEYSAVLPPVMGYKTAAVSRAMPNPRIDKLIINSRQKRGLKNISRILGIQTYPTLINLLNNGECLIIMIDQDTTVKGIFADFLGKQAYTPLGAAKLALDSKSPVVPMYMQRMPDNRHKFTILPQMPLIETGNFDNDILENTKAYNNLISEIIKEIPEQWVWMHRRWRTTPESLAVYQAKRKLEKERLNEQSLNT